MRMQNTQKGLGGFGMIILLVLLGAVVFLGFKVAPALLEQKKVLFAQESVASQLEASSRTRGQLEQDLLKRLQLDDVEGITRKQLYITKEGGQWQIRVAYERSVSLLITADIVLKYDETVLVPR